MFLRDPVMYAGAKLPDTAPGLSNGKRSKFSIKSMPALGYLEQSVGDAISMALTKAGTSKPKYPKLPNDVSVLVYLSLHLKASNPNASRESKSKYATLLSRYQNICDTVAKTISDPSGSKYDQY